MTHAGVIGAAQDEQTVVRALKELRKLGVADAVTYSPLGSEHLLEAQEASESPVRFYALAGGLIGLAGSLALTVGGSLNWPLITGGKPIVSLPAYVVVCFELTMLVAGIFTFVAWLIHSHFFGARRKHPGYRPEFSAVRFGIFVPCDADQVENVRRILLGAGLEEVAVVEA